MAGVYVVGETTTLTKLLALAGGTGTGDGNERSRVETTVRMLREQGGERVVVYEAEADATLREPRAHPALMDGDMVVVETEVHSRFNLRDTLGIVSSLATLTLLVLRVTSSN